MLMCESLKSRYEMPNSVGDGWFDHSEDGIKATPCRMKGQCRLAQFRFRHGKSHYDSVCPRVIADKNVPFMREEPHTVPQMHLQLVDGLPSAIGSDD